MANQIKGFRQGTILSNLLKKIVHKKLWRPCRDPVASQKGQEVDTQKDDDEQTERCISTTVFHK